MQSHREGRRKRRKSEGRKGVREGKKKKWGGGRGLAAVKSRAEPPGDWMLTPDMIEKMALENRGVCLISVHDGLSLFRRFSVIHPSLISSFKIVFARSHMCHQHRHVNLFSEKRMRFPFKTNIRI